MKVNKKAENKALCSVVRKGQFMERTLLLQSLDTFRQNNTRKNYSQTTSQDRTIKVMMKLLHYKKNIEH